MSAVAGSGRTVLFVSHNMGAVRTLCETGILLQHGRLVACGPIAEVTTKYLKDVVPTTSGGTVVLPRAPERCGVWMESVSVLRNGEPSAVVEAGDRLSFAVRFRSAEPIRKPIVGYLIRSARGENAVNANNYFLPSGEYPDPVTDGTVVCDLGTLPLMAGSYTVSFWLCRNPHEQHHVEDALEFTVEEKDLWGTGALPSQGLSCLWWPTHFKFS